MVAAAAAALGHRCQLRAVGRKWRGYTIVIRGDSNSIITFSGQYICNMSFAALAPPYPRSALADPYYAG